MRTTHLIAPLLFCLMFWQLLLSSAPAEAKLNGYVDLLSAEATGELRGQQFDAYRSQNGNDVFVGNQQLNPGTLLAAGFGLRLVFTTDRGLRFSGEGSGQGGRLLGLDAGYSASTVTRGELLAGVGYEHAFGRLVLHAAGIFGGDYAEFSVTQPAQLTGSISTSPNSGAVLSVPPGEAVTLRRWGLRLGAQAGAHVHLSKFSSLYGDVTLDYDGQWRTRFGLAFGQPSRR